MTGNRRRGSLLDEAMAASGGIARWNELSWFRAKLSIRGDLLQRNGWSGVLEDVRVEGTTREPFLRIADVGTPGPTAALLPERDFGGCVSWETFTIPFILSDPGFQTEELEPWRERGELWRRLFVWFPATIATQSPQQTFYFGADGLQRRVDFRSELAGDLDVALYCSEHKTFSGITFPTRKHVLRRDARDVAAPVPILMEISIVDAEFW